MAVIRIRIREFLRERVTNLHPYKLSRFIILIGFTAKVQRQVLHYDTIPIKSLTPLIMRPVLVIVNYFQSRLNKLETTLIL